MHNHVLKRFQFNFDSTPDLPGTFTIDMPLDAKVHAVEKVGSSWYMWASVNVNNSDKAYHFIVAEKDDQLSVFGACRFIGLVRTFKSFLFFQVTN